MSQKKQLTIMEFSRLTGIKRENLRFYDRIGLLTPAMRGENNYRYYARHQLSKAFLICDLRGLGVGIEDIKQYTAQRTPGKTLALFAQQEARMQAEIKRLREARAIMRLHADMVRDTVSRGDNALFLAERRREPIFLCPPIPAHMDDDQASMFSYDYAEAHGVNLGCPPGTLISQAQLASGDKTLGSRFYFKVAGGGNAYKGAGLYAVAHGYYDLWEVEPLYQRLLDFVKVQGLRICGDFYEEYPLSDTAAQDKEQYCVRVELPVARADS